MSPVLGLSDTNNVSGSGISGVYGQQKRVIRLSDKARSPPSYNSHMITGPCQVIIKGELQRVKPAPTLVRWA